jgi:hypothetical protein
LRAGLLADDCCWARLFWAASRHLGPAVIGPRLRSTRPILLSPGPYVDEQEIYVSSLSTNKRIKVFFDLWTMDGENIKLHHLSRFRESFISNLLGAFLALTF